MAVRRTHRVVGVADAQKVVFAREQRRHASPPERRLWQAIRDNALGVRFRRQHPLGPAVLDFYCAELGLALEVDGSHHRDQLGYDERRDEYLREAGIHTVRIPARDVMKDLPQVLEMIAGEVHTARGGPTPCPPLRSGEGEPETERGA